MSGDHSATTNFNKEILTRDLGLTQYSNTTVFKKAGYFILSPSIQNEAKWFDLRKVNLDKYDCNGVKGYLIVRFFSELLLADLNEFCSKMISTDNYVDTKNSGIHWKFNIKCNEGESYIAVNQKNKKSFILKIVDVEGLKHIIC